MTPKQRLLMDFNPATFHTLPCCGIKSSTHAGRCVKECWLQSNLQFGLRAKTLIDPVGHACGYIEYLPGEFAWSGVQAKGYMFIHCLWNHSKQHQRRGLGSSMVKACLKEAKEEDRNGVAVVTRAAPWLADRRVFEANGFELADTAPPDYALLVRKLKANAADPAFKGDWDQKAARYGRGLTIIRSSQCPYITKFAEEIEATAQLEYGIKPRVVDLKSWQDAQNAPTPYAVFALIYNGRVIADHQVSRARFRNILNKLGDSSLSRPPTIGAM